MKFLSAVFLSGVLTVSGIAPVVADESPATPQVNPTVSTQSAANFDGRFWGLSLGYADGSYQTGVSALGQLGVVVDVDGAMFGARYGHNFQNGNRVVGYDIELSSGPDGLTSQGTAGPFWLCGSGDCVIDVDAMLSARGRYGMVMGNGKTMVYGAAGITVARYQGGILNSVQYGPKNTGTGFNVALGLEHLLNAQTSIFGEISHTDLGNLDFGQGIAPTDVYDGLGDFQQIRIGVNVKF